MNYSIPHPNARATHQLGNIEESLTFVKHDVVHTTSMLGTECLVSNWHIARLPPNSAKQCWALQAITGIICNAKVGSNKHDTSAPTYKGLKKEFRFTNNVEYEFWFCPDDIKHCVSGTKKKYVLDWPIVPNTWPMKMGTYLSREEVLALKDVGFQLQEKKALSPRRRFSTIPTISILRSHFVCHCTRMPTLHLGLERQCVIIQQHRRQITKTNGRALDSWTVTMWLVSLLFHI